MMTGLNSRLACALFISALPAHAQSLNCDLREYKPQPGLQAELSQHLLRLSWQGERGDDLRASFTIRNGQPLITELAVRKSPGGWSVLGTDLTPEFEVTSGVRRISNQQLQPLRALGRTITSEIIDKEKWNAFWDAPLEIPGSEGTNPGLPRRPEEIRRAVATYNSSGCAVKTNGARLELSFPGFSAGIFAGRLMYTVYKGSNLLRQDAVAKTDQPSVAYKYRTGLKGFGIGEDSRIAWRDTARAWQAYRFGGARQF
ncbi:MAG: hypothetical protein ACRD7E_05495 [Bryobacteraceae bacterium]